MVGGGFEISVEARGVDGGHDTEDRGTGIKLPLLGCAGAVDQKQESCEKNPDQQV
jgi:hypothetical protein